MITGTALLIVPGDGSFWAYTHLVASAWWTALLLWHLRRYFVGSLVTVLANRRNGQRSLEGFRASEEALAAAKFRRS
jgi:hypothetical protein